MKDYNKIAEDIKILLDINVFEKRRPMHIVDARSMYCYILRHDLKYRLCEIKNIFIKNGMYFDHSSVHYNINLFEEVRSRRPELEQVRETLLKVISPKFKLTKTIEKLNDDKKIELVQLFIDTLN
jgi:chromosomal replication initiation ATPase DnaA